MTESAKEPASDWASGKMVMAGDMFLGLYQPSPETVGFWEGVGRRELLFRWCEPCGRAHHPRRMVCSQCASTDLGWKRASGRGKVYSFSEVHRAPSAQFGKAAPYTVGLVATEEGVHFFCRIIAEGEGRIAVDAPAVLDFRVLETGQLLPVFVVR